MSGSTQQEYLRIVGARILSEANDLKRTKETLAAELGFDLNQIELVIRGEADEDAAHAVLHAMIREYPISLGELWVERDDSNHGVRVMTGAQSMASQRVFDRPDGQGHPSPYYEYRDTAMSRTAPFKPEWIKELRVVADTDPYNMDVAFNNGHLMHQATFFVGPVNFYWEVDGQRHCAELDTGDSNYITPFVRHSFTSRNPEELGLIIAVTYGGEVRRALSALTMLGPEGAAELVSDPRQPDRAFTRLVARQRAAESLSDDQLIARIIDAGIDEERAHYLLRTGGPTPEETVLIASALNVHQRDLEVTPLHENEEVVVCLRRDTTLRYYPNEEAPAYELAELARTRHQPYLKGFAVSVLGGPNGDMQHSLHEYIYNYGKGPVRMVWNQNQNVTLAPGDSAYVQPGVTHRFEVDQETQPGQLVMIRIPGALTNSTVGEYSAFDPQGRSRATGETKRWF